jgi:hypothetical protein
LRTGERQQRLKSRSIYSINSKFHQPECLLPITGGLEKSRQVLLDLKYQDPARCLRQLLRLPFFAGLERAYVCMPTHNVYLMKQETK